MSAVFVRTTAFLTRSIRQESRLISHHVMRGLLALVILIVGAGLFYAVSYLGKKREAQAGEAAAAQGS